MIKYGVETITSDSDKITMYVSKSRAQADAEAKASALQAGESVTLFYAECDAEGRLATSEFHIVSVWTIDPTDSR